MPKAAPLQKPSLAAVSRFAEQHRDPATVSRIGRAPEGSVRLTVNIRKAAHRKLKIRAAQKDTTIGALIEAWIAEW